MLTRDEVRAIPLLSGLAAAAVGQGSMAIAFVHQYLQHATSI